jgi:6-phosphogluconolactonase
VFSANPTTGFLTRVEIVPSGGKTPRNFAISPNGKWLVCGHQDSNNLTVFHINQDNGRLEKTAQTATVPAAVCVLFYD